MSFIFIPFQEVVLCISRPSHGLDKINRQYLLLSSHHLWKIEFVWFIIPYWHQWLKMVNFVRYYIRHWINWCHGMLLVGWMCLCLRCGFDSLIMEIVGFMLVLLKFYMDFLMYFSCCCNLVLLFIVTYFWIIFVYVLMPFLQVFYLHLSHILQEQFYFLFVLSSIFICFSFFILTRFI